MPTLPFNIDPFINTLGVAAETAISGVQSIHVENILKKQMKSTYAEGSFNFSRHVGTYTWNFQTGRWDFSSLPTNKIIVNYPVQGSTTNNGVLTIHNYTEVRVTQDGIVEYLPTYISFDILVNNTMAVDFNLEASYNTQGEPQTLTFSLMLVPYDIHFSFNFIYTNAGFNVSVAGHVKEGGTSIFSGNLLAAIKTESTEYGTNMYLATLNGWVQLSQLKATIDINMEPISNVVEPTVEQLNDAIKISLYQYPDNAKIADVRFRSDISPNAERPVIVVLVFSDGSEDPIEEHLSELMPLLEIVPD